MLFFVIFVPAFRLLFFLFYIIFVVSPVVFSYRFFVFFPVIAFIYLCTCLAVRATTALYSLVFGELSQPLFFLAFCTNLCYNVFHRNLLHRFRSFPRICLNIWRGFICIISNRVNQTFTASQGRGVVCC